MPESALKQPAAEAIRRGDIAVALRSLERGDVDIDQLAEMLRIYHAELLIQNEELRASHNRLEASERRFVRLFENMPESVLVIDGRGTVKDCNAAAEALLGMQASRLRGHLLGRLVSARNVNRVLSLLEEIAHSGTSSSVEVEVPSGGRMRAAILRLARVSEGPREPIECLAVLSDITPLKEAEEERRQNEARWIMAIEGAGHGVWDWSAASGKMFFSVQWKQLLGYQESEISDSPSEWFDRLHPDDAEAIYREFSGPGRVIPTGPLEFRLRHRDGHFLWVRHQGMVFSHNADCTPQRVVGTHTDISMAKQTEWKLRERNKEANCLHHIFKATERSELSIAEILSTAVSLLPAGWQFPLKAAARIRYRAESYETPGFSECREMQIVSFQDESGTAGDVAVAYPEPPADPEALFLDEELALINAAADRLGETIRGRQRSERLRMRDDIFRSIVDQAEDGIVLIDCDSFRFAEFNDAACRSLGYSREEFAALDLIAVQADLNREDMARIVVEVMQTHHACFEVRHRHKNGTVHDFRVSNTLLNLGGRSYLSAIWTDITEQKCQDDRLQKSLDELSRSNAELERFAFVAAHDLQEPVRNVVSFSQLLERNMEKRINASDHELLDFIIIGAKRMRDLVADLLSYSRVTNTQEPNALVDLNECVRQAMVNLNSAIEDSHCEFCFGILPNIQGNPIQIVQLFQNLFANAIKFRCEDRPLVISVACQKSDDVNIMCVGDTGIGIEAQYHEEVFEAFRRLHPIGSYPGTGMGLAICKRIVERHGGTIWIEPGGQCGTTVCFSIPDLPRGNSQQMT